MAPSRLAANCGFGLGAVPTPGGQPKDPPPAVKSEPAATPADGEKTFGGQVLGPDGKPVAGAKLYTLYYTPKILPIPTLVRATTVASDPLSIHPRRALSHLHGAQAG